MTKITVSGFYDEISGDLDKQIAVLHELGEQYLCPRTVNGKNIADYTFEEFEKDGVYAVLNQQFAKRSSSFLYLNREEDMGVEGLRKSKLSYKPNIVLEKFYGVVE